MKTNGGHTPCFSGKGWLLKMPCLCCPELGPQQGLTRIVPCACGAGDGREGRLALALHQEASPRNRSQARMNPARPWAVPLHRDVLQALVAPPHGGGWGWGWEGGVLGMQKWARCAVGEALPQQQALWTPRPDSWLSEIVGSVLTPETPLPHSQTPGLGRGLLSGAWKQSRAQSVQAQAAPVGNSSRTSS